jgi:hypothetical protein
MSARECNGGSGMVSTNRHAMITSKMFWGHTVTFHLAAQSPNLRMAAPLLSTDNKRKHRAFFRQVGVTATPIHDWILNYKGIYRQL